MYVYAEEVFLVNFLMDGLLAMFVMKNYGAAKYAFRAALCGIIGGIYAVTGLYVNTGIISKLAVCMIMGYIINNKSFYDAAFSGIMLILGSLLSVGGIVLAESLCGNMPFIGKNLFTMLSGAISGLFLFNMTVKTTRKYEGVKGGTFGAEITFMEKNIKLRLLNDSGNLLKTAWGESVVIISEDVFFRSFPDLKGFAAENGLPEIYEGRISFVMAGSVTGERMFTVLKADNLTVPEKNISLSPVYISAAKINDSRFDGIINLNIMGGENAEKTYP